MDELTKLLMLAALVADDVEERPVPRRRQWWRAEEDLARHRQDTLNREALDRADRD